MDHVKLLCDIGELSSIFTESVSIETILQRIAEMVARHMQADVCSIYLFDEERQDLVLKATIGLNPESIDRVRLKMGEGIAGFALKELRPICEKEGSKHPKYKYFPGIFEERFEVFLAVPIARGISRIGVMAVQREKGNCFDEGEIMAMRAVASQLANIIENARLLMKVCLPVLSEIAPEPHPVRDIRFVKGKAASEGFALAPISVLDKEKAIEILTHKEFEGISTIEDFDRAVELSERQLEALQAQVGEKLSDVASLIFTAHLMMLKDKEFVGKMRRLIEGGDSPSEAVAKVAKEYIEIFSKSPSPYIREKVQDIKDLVIRLMQNLLSGSRDARGYEGCIVVARDLFPSDILKLSSEGALGIVLVTGGVTSHIAILARSLQIPMVIADAPQILELSEDTRMLLDAEIGNIYINPTEDIIANFRARNEARASLAQERRSMCPTTHTRDGIRVRLMANINLLTDLRLAKELKAEGVGLYRTEFPFLIRSDFPTEEEQYVIYKKLIEGMPGKEIIFRTLDIGGDKVLSYYLNPKEQNPFLGMRSIRFSLQNKEIFEQQVCAMLRAGEGAKIGIMFPMISSLEEFGEARDTVFECIKALKGRGLPHNKRPKVGMMVEIPSVVEVIDAFAKEADFFSIGTNDFIQYMLAVDRTNEKVAGFYLPYHPAVLRSIKRVADAAKAGGIGISICGDMAHDERYIPFLLGAGIREFSTDPMYLPRMQKLISRIDIKDAEDLAKKVLEQVSIKAIADILFNGSREGAAKGLE